MAEARSATDRASSSQKGTTLTTTTITADHGEAPPYDRGPSLRIRAVALIRLGTRIFDGAPVRDVDVYGRAMAHPDLSAASVRELVKRAGIGERAGQPEMMRRAVFALLHGPDVAPCAVCVKDRRRPIDYVSGVGDCFDPTHLPASAVTAVA